MQPTELIVAAQQALGSGDVAAATEHARGAVEPGGGPAAREMLAGLLLVEDDIEGARREYELTFREWRQAGQHKAAALVAATLADLHTSWLGNHRAGQGWAARGHRLLEPYGRCIERGYVDLAVLACELPDVHGVEIAAAAALDLALEFGDSDLEVRDLADSGYALVVQGRTRDGFARLDEAMAALSAGEVRNPAVAAMSFCALLAACERAGDVARAEEWTRVVARGVTEPLGNRPRALHTHCLLVLGSVLCTTGRWDEGEAALLEAVGPRGSAMYAHRSEASVRLAALHLPRRRCRRHRRDRLRVAAERDDPPCRPGRRVEGLGLAELVGDVDGAVGRHTGIVLEGVEVDLHPPLHAGGVERCSGRGPRIKAHERAGEGEGGDQGDTEPSGSELLVVMACPSSGRLRDDGGPGRRPRLEAFGPSGRRRWLPTTTGCSE